MFQLLLKATNPNSAQPDSNPPNGSRRPKPNNPLVVQTQKYQHDWKSPPDHYKRNSSQNQSIRETPAFLQKLHELGHQIQEVNDEPQAVGSYEPSEKVSQVLSVNEMTGEYCHPMILSNIHPQEKQTYDKLSLLKIRNELSELKQVHLDLTEYLEDERRLNYDFQDKICLDIEDFFLELMARIKQKNGSSQELNQIKKQNAGLALKLQRKERECQQLSRQLVEMQNKIEQERNKPKERTSREKPIDKSESAVWRSLEAEISSLKKKIENKQQEMEELLCENQRLQEHIFDIQQKIVGVDLEVEKKLKEKLSLLPEGYRQPAASAPVVPLTQQNNELKDKITLLQQKLRQYEQKLRLSSDLDNRLAKIRQKELELEQREELLKEAQMKNEELKQANYEREHQILQAEENLSAKIADLRHKEAQLSSWETQLIRKANETRQPLNLKYPTEEADYRMSFQDELNNSKEISLKSFGRTPQNGQHNDELQHKISPRRNYTQQDIETFNPRQQLYKINQNRYDADNNPPSARRAGEGRRQTDNVYTSKVAYPSTAARNLKLVKSNYRDSRQASPYRNMEQRSRGHYGGAVPGGNNYRDLSKNSRSSATKSMRGGFGSQTLGIRPRGDTQPMRVRGETQQITGLSTKLQRLREEIKKEIDSIK